MRGRGRETKVAREEWQCFNWFIVLVGLFEQITKVLLGANEQQVTVKVHSLALADNSKTVCLH